jgi:hypothetical protein
VRRAGRRWGGLQRTVLGEDRLLQPLQRRGRVDAQLLGQHRAGLLVDAQRVRLPPGAVQRQHQLPAPPLPPRLGGHQRLQLADQLCVAAGGEPELGQLLDRGPPQLLQAGGLGLRPGLVGELRQRRPPPQPQRLPEQPRRLGRVRRRDPMGRGDQPLEPGRVDPLGVHLQPVAGGPGGQQPRGLPERPAEGRHPALQGVRRLPWRTVAPQVVDQAVGRHHLPGVQQQVGQQGALLGARDHDRSRAVVDLQWPQDPELHPTSASVPTANPQRHVSAPAHRAIGTRHRRRRHR